MTTKESSVAIRRILFALDHCAHEHDCVDYVADLAARLHAELMGIFVEDTDLLRTAQHPFVREINLLTGAVEKLDSASTEESLRSRARISEASLRSAASQRKVKWSFRVVRGRVHREVETAAADVDLLVVQSGGSSRTAAWMMQLGRAFDAPETGAAGDRSLALTRSVLVIRPGPLVRNPILLVYRGGESMHHAIEITQRLTVAEQMQVPIITMAQSGAEGNAIAQETQRLLGANAAGAKFLPPIPMQLEYLQSYIEKLPAGMIILGADCPLLARITPEALSDRLARPVLVIR